MTELSCRWCGQRFERPHQRGPAPKYCSKSHRQRAFENRRILQSTGFPITDQLLTAAEHRALSLTVELINLWSRIVGDGPTRSGDLNEMVADIHRIQHRIMAQAAARAYPRNYRLAGSVVGDARAMTPRVVRGDLRDPRTWVEISPGDADDAGVMILPPELDLAACDAAVKAMEEDRRDFESEAATTGGVTPGSALI